MKRTEFIVYYRKSNRRRVSASLALERQESCINAFVANCNGTIVEIYTELENDRHEDRPALAKALAACLTRDCILLIGRVGHLNRNTAFLIQLRAAGVECASADNLVLNQSALRSLDLPDEEAFTKERKEAQAQKKANRKQSFYKNVSPESAAAWLAARQKARLTERDAYIARIAPIIAEIRASGVQTLKGIAEALNRRSVCAPRGGAWSSRQVMRVL